MAEMASLTQKQDIPLRVEIVKNLQAQISEIEFFESVYSHQEFIMDRGILVHVNEYIDGKTDVSSNVYFTLNLLVDDKRLEISVDLPISYPNHDPEIYVRSESFTRETQLHLNSDLKEFVSCLEKGEVCVFSAVLWIQEHLESYFAPAKKLSRSKAKKDLTAPKPLSKKFSRYWIHSHHIYSKDKRKYIADLAYEFKLTGFCLPGKPGIICVEGLEADCIDWWDRVRNMNWKKIVTKKTEEEQVSEDTDLVDLRKFSDFRILVFHTSGKHNNHMDMGEFHKWLNQHGCAGVFNDIFGFESKNA